MGRPFPSTPTTTRSSLRIRPRQRFSCSRRSDRSGGSALSRVSPDSSSTVFGGAASPSPAATAAATRASAPARLTLFRTNGDRDRRPVLARLDELDLPIHAAAGEVDLGVDLLVLVLRHVV